MENRLKGDTKNDCLISIDGTDFNIAEHGTKWYIHKFKISELRYEVGICFFIGDIVLANIPYEPEVYNDIIILDTRLKVVWDLPKQSKPTMDTLVKYLCA